MFGLIGHLTSLAHAKRVADKLGYSEYAESDLEFWCMAPQERNYVCTIKVHCTSSKRIPPNTEPTGTVRGSCDF